MAIGIVTVTVTFAVTVAVTPTFTFTVTSTVTVTGVIGQTIRSVIEWQQSQYNQSIA